MIKLSQWRLVEGRKGSQSRDMLSNLDVRVVKLEVSMGDVKETLKEVDECTTEL